MERVGSFSKRQFVQALGTAVMLSTVSPLMLSAGEPELRKRGPSPLYENAGSEAARIRADLERTAPPPIQVTPMPPEVREKVRKESLPRVTSSVQQLPADHPAVLAEAEELEFQAKLRAIFIQNQNDPERAIELLKEELQNRPNAGQDPRDVLPTVRIAGE